MSVTGNICDWYYHVDNYFSLVWNYNNYENGHGGFSGSKPSDPDGTISWNHKS